MPDSKNADERSGSEPKLLSGGNPEIPKGEGDERNAALHPASEPEASEAARLGP